MSIALRTRAELTANEIACLEKAMSDFYRNPPANYYQIANHAARHYKPSEQPFHCDLVERVQPGASVVEVGCGTAHLCSHVEHRGGAYVGLDFSEALLKENQRRYPRARFFPVTTQLEETFDLVASLYTVEHVADPPAYLERLWSYCRPGGLIAIIGPEFVGSPAFPPSFFFGTTPRRLREKLRTGAFLDAARHVIDLKIIAPRWRRRARAGPPGAFWINLCPRALRAGEFQCDADAIHMVRLADLVWFCERKGGRVLATSSTLPDIPAEVRRFNCYLVARKPETTR